MYMLAAVSVMNRKQVRQQGGEEGLRPKTRGLMSQHALHYLMLMRTTHRLTPALHESKITTRPDFSLFHAPQKSQH
jgi:hypothetical protein